MLGESQSTAEQAHTANRVMDHHYPDDDSDGANFAATSSP
jgi:hypothetical protein